MKSHELLCRGPVRFKVEKILKAMLPGGRFTEVSPLRSRTMSAILAKNNRTTELRFRMALVRLALSGWVTHADLQGHPDFYFPAAKLAIFLDGCFWHGCRHCGHIPKTNSFFWKTKIGRNQARDRKNTRALRKRGFIVVRVWEHAMKEPKTLQRILNRIQGLITTK
jgi:DNA mismatch endonuclease (patch repair protein)